MRPDPEKAVFRARAFRNVLTRLGQARRDLILEELRRAHCSALRVLEQGRTVGVVEVNQLVCGSGLAGRSSAATSPMSPSTATATIAST
jgi:hypothetical protein